MLALAISMEKDTKTNKIILDAKNQILINL